MNFADLENQRKLTFLTLLTASILSFKTGYTFWGYPVCLNHSNSISSKTSGETFCMSFFQQNSYYTMQTGSSLKQSSYHFLPK